MRRISPGIVASVRPISVERSVVIKSTHTGLILTLSRRGRTGTSDRRARCGTSCGNPSIVLCCRQPQWPSDDPRVPTVWCRIARFILVFLRSWPFYTCGGSMKKCVHIGQSAAVVKTGFATSEDIDKCQVLSNRASLR